MNAQDRLDLKRIMQQSGDYEDNTEGIRRLKHSDLIQADVAKIEALKKEFATLRKESQSAFQAKCTKPTPRPVSSLAKNCLIKRGIVVDRDHAAPEAKTPATKNPMADCITIIKPMRLKKISKCEPMAGFMTPIRSQTTPVNNKQRQANTSLLPPKNPVI